MDEHRFIALWKRAGAASGQSKALRLCRSIVDHYGEPHRRYHTGDHIRHCLRQVDLIPADYEHRDAVELAIWFHDVIYQIGDPKNERNSAEWFVRHAREDLPDPIVDRVYRMIIATEHREPPGNTDVAYVVDIDLSSFGLPFDEFIADSRLVRAESTHLTDEQYFDGQRRFLRALLARERIFVTDLFNGLYEARARRNIQSTLENIGALNVGG